MSTVPDSRAAEVLRSKIEQFGQSGVKRKSGVAQPTLSQIANLHRKPGLKVTLALAKIGIRIEWWSAPPRRRAA